jgi:hypothetical protein
LVVSGANTPDPAETPQHLCLNEGYSDAPSAAVAAAQGYVLHVPDKANAVKNASASRGGAKRGAGSWKSRTPG